MRMHDEDSAVYELHGLGDEPKALSRMSDVRKIKETHGCKSVYSKHSIFLRL